MNKGCAEVVTHLCLFPPSITEFYKKKEIVLNFVITRCKTLGVSAIFQKVKTEEEEHPVTAKKKKTKEEIEAARAFKMKKKEEEEQQRWRW